MKNMRNKMFLFVLALGGLLLTGCREEEELNLPGYPVSSVGISIDGEDEGVLNVELNAVYDHAGKIQLDGPISRKYVFALTAPSPEDVTLFIEPLAVNIPLEKVSIDKTEIRIPAGARLAEPVTVSLEGDDFSFAEAERQACTYELGVKVTDCKGYKVAFEGGNEAKVVIDKVPYTAGLSIYCADGNTVEFARVYRDGAILNEDRMSQAFKVRLERPAQADTKVTFTSEGLPAAYADDVTVTPSSVTIPAGATESEEIVWSLTDDFLLASAEEEEYTLTLTAEAESADEAVSVLENRNVLTFEIAKVFSIVQLVDAPEDDWTRLSRTGWTATGEGGWGKPGNVLDGSTYSDYYTTGESLWIAIDMTETKSVRCLDVYYYGSYASKACLIESSLDGETWEELGSLTDLPITQHHYFKFMAPINARYLKFTSVEKHGHYHDISEIEVYSK